MRPNARPEDAYPLFGGVEDKCELSNETIDTIFGLVSISSVPAFSKEASLMKNEVPIWEKSNLTLEEAAAYSGIGINKLREISNERNCRFVLWIGNKRLIKRRLLDTYIEQAYSI